MTYYHTPLDDSKRISQVFPILCYDSQPLHGPDPGFVLPLTGKPDASDTKTQTGRES